MEDFFGAATCIGFASLCRRGKPLLTSHCINYIITNYTKVVIVYYLFGRRISLDTRKNIARIPFL